MTTESPKKKFNFKNCLAIVGGLAGIVAILGLGVAAVQFWFQLSDSKSQEKAQSTLISISDAQLQAEKTLVALQLNPDSQSEIVAIKSTIESLQSQRETLEALLPGQIPPGNSSRINSEVLSDTPTPEPSVSFPFEDNFDNGIRSEWKIAAGAPVIVNGELGSVKDELSIQLNNFLPITHIIEFDYNKNSGCVAIISLGENARFEQSYNIKYLVFLENEWVEIGSSELNDSKKGHLRIEINENRYSVIEGGTKVFEIVHGQEITGDLGITIKDSSNQCPLFLDNVIIETK